MHHFKAFLSFYFSIITMIIFSPFYMVPYCFSALKNLENNTQDFLLETRQLIIPGIPDAFNPSIIRWNNSLLMSFRAHDPVTQSATLVYLVLLDEDFNLLSHPQLLDMPVGDALLNQWPQDPRPIIIKDELYFVYNKFDSVKEGVNRRMAISKLSYDGNLFALGKTESLTNFPGEIPKRQEKNWSPFEYEENLFLIYSIIPHRVFLPTGMGECQLVTSLLSPIKWPWGEPRGGTQAQLVDGQYLSFFHSCKDMITTHSKGKRMVHYFMGAYTYSAHPPFDVTAFSPEPIVGKGFYEGPEYKTWKPLRVVFPGGFIFNEQHIWLLYGRQDHELWIAKLDKKQLLNSLIPTSYKNITE